MSEEDPIADMAVQHGGWATALLLILWKVWDAISVRGAVSRLEDSVVDMKADLSFIKGRLAQADKQDSRL